MLTANAALIISQAACKVLYVYYAIEFSHHPKGQLPIPLLFIRQGNNGSTRSCPKVQQDLVQHCTNRKWMS